MYYGRFQEESCVGDTLCRCGVYGGQVFVVVPACAGGAFEEGYDGDGASGAGFRECDAEF